MVLSGEGGERFLTDLDSGQVYELNEAAVLAFEAVQGGGTRAGVVAALAAQYPEVPRAELERDADELLAMLLGAGLLEPAR